MIAVAFNANLVKSPFLIREITFAFFGPQLLRDGTRQILPLYFNSPSRLGYIVTQSWADAYDFHGALTRDVVVIVCYAQILSEFISG